MLEEKFKIIEPNTQKRFMIPIPWDWNIGMSQLYGKGF